MRILVVDDEANLRRMMRLTLETTGYDVAEAASGEEGLRLFDDGYRFDATLLDQRMPGMDGLEALRRMKQQRADACVVMVTAYATIDLAVEAMKLGATDFVRKPMTPDTLRHAVDAALARRSPSAATAGPATPATRETLPPAELWTTNGFFIQRVTASVAPFPDRSEHHFVVRRGKDAAGVPVVVVIDPGVVKRIARDGRRDLGPSGAFWRAQAEGALVNYLWTEAALPEDGRVTIDRATGSMVNEATGWKGD